MNKVTLLGNLGNDPEIRSTANGSRVATLSLATSQQWKNQAGEKQEKTQWHRLVCWDNAKGPKLATVVESYCRKGDKILVEGMIEYRQWQDREGVTRYSTEIVVRELIMLSGKTEGERPALQPAAAAKGKESFEDFPEALDAEDDDLSF